MILDKFGLEDIEPNQQHLKLLGFKTFKENYIKFYNIKTINIWQDSNLIKYISNDNFPNLKTLKVKDTSPNSKKNLLLLDLCKKKNIKLRFIFVELYSFNIRKEILPYIEFLESRSSENFNNIEPYLTKTKKIYNLDGFCDILLEFKKFTNINNFKVLVLNNLDMTNYRIISGEKLKKIDFNISIFKETVIFKNLNNLKNLKISCELINPDSNFCNISHTIANSKNLEKIHLVNFPTKKLPFNFKKLDNLKIIKIYPFNWNEKFVLPIFKKINKKMFLNMKNLLKLKFNGSLSKKIYLNSFKIEEVDLSFNKIKMI